MYHVLHWHKIDHADQQVADAAEHAIRNASTDRDRRAPLQVLRHLPSYRIMTAGQMRGIRAAMGWLGMGDGTRPTGRSAYALPGEPTRLTSAPEPRSPVGVVDELTADAQQRQHLFQRELEQARDGNHAGIPLRTLTIPALTWEVAGPDCAAALRRWRLALLDWRDDLELLYDGCGLTTQQRRRSWLSWITFLAGAATHAGFHAEGATHPLNSGSTPWASGALGT